MKMKAESPIPGILMCENDEEVKEFLTRAGRLDELTPQPEGNHIIIGGQTSFFWWIAARFYNTKDDGYLMVFGAKEIFTQHNFSKMVTEVIFNDLVPDSPIYFLDPPKKEAN